MIFMSEFNPSVMNGNLSRLILEQYVEQGQLIECRDRLYRIYCQMNGPAPDLYAQLLVDSCADISTSVANAILPIEGMHLLPSLREVFKTRPTKTQIQNYFQDQMSMDFGDYLFVCESISMLGLPLYDPVAFDENDCLITITECSGDRLEQHFRCLMAAVLNRENLPVSAIIQGKNDVKKGIEKIGMTLKNREVYYVERAAAEGNARALYLYAKMKLKANDNIEYSTVIQLLSRAAAKGEILAYFELGLLYDSFESGCREVAKAVEMYAKAYECGDVRAAARIGDMCFAFAFTDGSIEEFSLNDSNGIEDAAGLRNFMEQFATHECQTSDPEIRYRKAALRWYRLGASLGDGYGWYRLAACLEAVYLPGDDSSEILNGYQKAAESGVGQAACALGRIYEIGRVTGRNVKLAKEWFSIGASLGSAEAAYRLGVMLGWNHCLISVAESMGYLSEDNFPRKYGKLEELAQKGNVKAQYAVACILIHGKTESDGYYPLEIAADKDAAYLWFRRAAAQGYFRAYGILGILEETKDKKMGSPSMNPWFKRGAKYGLGYACWRLYKNRCEHLKEYALKASELYSDLSPINMWTLGRLYEKGFIVSSNPKKTAYEFYKKAAETNFTSGIVSVSEMLLSGSISDPSVNVYEELMDAARTGDVCAVCLLAYCMERGLGCLQDLHGAVHLYYLASIFGNIKAMVGYGRTALSVFGQDEYIGSDNHIGRTVLDVKDYLDEISDALQLDNRYFAHVKPTDYLTKAVDKGSVEAIEILAKYYAIPRWRNRVGYNDAERFPHNLYFEDNLKKAVSYFEQAISHGRVNLESELAMARSRLSRCIKGRYLEPIADSDLGVAVPCLDSELCF